MPIHAQATFSRKTRAVRSSGRYRMGLCELRRSEQAHSFHHFIPCTLHSNKWFKRRFTRSQMQHGTDACEACHVAIHRLFPHEKELGRNFNTREKLLSHPEVGKFVCWKAKQRTALLDN